MADHRQTEEAEQAPAFAVDRIVDKAVRFGCGAILAGLIVVALVIFGLPVPFGMPGIVTLGILFILSAGFLGVTHGEHFIRGLLKVMSWL